MAKAFTVETTWREGGPEGKTILAVRGILAITVSGEGGAVDDLPASLFKLNRILDCGPIVNDGEDLIIHGSPDYTGDSLITADPTDGTLLDLPVDNYRLTVKGY